MPWPMPAPVRVLFRRNVGQSDTLAARVTGVEAASVSEAGLIAALLLDPLEQAKAASIQSAAVQRRKINLRFNSCDRRRNSLSIYPRAPLLFVIQAPFNNPSRVIPGGLVSG